jgi:hypothetical protein
LTPALNARLLTCMFFLLFVGGVQQQDGKLFLSYADTLKRL